MITHRYARRDELRALAEGRLRRRAREPQGARRRRRARPMLPSARRIKRWLLADPADAAPRSIASSSPTRSPSSKALATDLRDAPGAGARCGSARPNRPSSCSRACRTGATAPKRPASRRSRSSRCSSSVTRDRPSDRCDKKAREIRGLFCAPMSDIKIRLVCATRVSLDDFSTQTALGKSLALYGYYPFVEARVFARNAAWPSENLQRGDRER